ncbi:MAG: TatD family hydrolase [candidate division WOR-3 bacterium]
MTDTHCHLIDPQFHKDLDEVIFRAKKSGITRIINIGYDLPTSRAAIEINSNYPWILPAIGFHPNETAEDSITKIPHLEDILKEKKVIAVGETGLDYYRDFSPKKAQQELFRQHISLAKRYQLPLIIHTRNSFEDVVKILREEKYDRGVFHCYSGTYEQAKEIISLGFYLGFGGVLTYSRRVREVFQRLPLNCILLETDAPFLSPQGHRGERNEPAFITETVNVASAIHKMHPEELTEITDQNAQRLFMPE